MVRGKLRGQDVTTGCCEIPVQSHYSKGQIAIMQRINENSSHYKAVAATSGLVSQEVGVANFCMKWVWLVIWPAGAPRHKRVA